MIKLFFTCNYCNHKWDAVRWSLDACDDIKCPVCKDVNITIKRPGTEEKKDYYAPYQKTRSKKGALY